MGSSIEFEITIPGESIGSEESVRLHCHGQVVRCDLGPDGRTGVACMIERYEFLRTAEVGGE